MTVDDFTLQTIETEFGIEGLLMECPDPECRWWCSFLYPTMGFMEQHAQRHIWERHGTPLETRGQFVEQDPPDRGGAPDE